jgi:hypothetical protein
MTFGWGSDEPRCRLRCVAEIANLAAPTLKLWLVRSLLGRKACLVRRFVLSRSPC